MHKDIDAPKTLDTTQMEILVKGNAHIWAQYRKLWEVLILMIMLYCSLLLWIQRAGTINKGDKKSGFSKS